jgi:UDP-N-acetylglucosamine diphosphorylase/glucosamine-1-phosphate N-acetyltransferase
MKIYIFEDEGYKNFLPLTYFTPVYNLRCGCFTLKEKLEKYFKSNSAFLVRDYLADYLREVFPKQKINELTPDDALLINGRLIADKELVRKIKYKKDEDKVFINQETLVAAHFSSKTFKSLYEKCGNHIPDISCLSEFPVHEIDSQLVNHPWDLIRINGDQTKKDYGLISSSLKRKIAGKIHKGASLICKMEIIVGSGSEIFPGVVLNATGGPIVIGKDVTIMSNAVITGPAFIGDQSLVKVGAKIYPNTSIGEVCKVGGEIDGTIIQSYSNKQHDGYLGHAYVGSWVNIGADTNNSDLKNNYSNVKVMLNGKLQDTGMQHFGTLIGDHSKTGINMMFDTGTIIGASCNLYGAGLPPRYIPSFVRGSVDNTYKTHSVEMALETAKIVMIRRDVNLSPSYEQLFRKVFELTQLDRDAAKIIR